MTHISEKLAIKNEYKLPPAAFPLQWVRENDYYFYQKQIKELRGGRVLVEGHGEMILLSSYSYLGLLGHPQIEAAAKDAIDQFSTGAHGVRLLAGTLPIHVALEQKLAEIKNSDDAIVFSSGYIANLSTISALVGRKDYVFCDKLNHASIVDGCQLSGANLKRFRHNDIDHLKILLAKVPHDANKLVVVDAVFSMDGDIINLPKLSEVCREYSALLMVDEAHSLGVIGRKGRGIEEHFGLPPNSIDIKMGTLSKTIPSVGGYICGSTALIDLIKNRGRGFIYSAALPPACAAAALESLNVIENEQWRLEKLQKNIVRFRDGIKAAGLNTLNTETAIIPVVIGDNELAYRIAQYCQRNGIFVQCIPHPVVPKGTERLRCIVTTDHNPEDIDYCIQTIVDSVRLSVR